MLVAALPNPTRLHELNRRIAVQSLKREKKMKRLFLFGRVEEFPPLRDFSKQVLILRKKKRPENDRGEKACECVCTRMVCMGAVLYDVCVKRKKSQVIYFYYTLYYFPQMGQHTDTGIYICS